MITVGTATSTCSNTLYTQQLVPVGTSAHRHIAGARSGCRCCTFLTRASTSLPTLGRRALHDLPAQMSGGGGGDEEDYSKMGFFGLFFMGFFWVCGGIYGTEAMVTAAPTGWVFTTLWSMSLLYALPSAHYLLTPRAVPLPAPVGPYRAPPSFLVYALSLSVSPPPSLPLTGHTAAAVGVRSRDDQRRACCRDPS